MSSTFPDRDDSPESKYIFNPASLFPRNSYPHETIADGMASRAEYILGPSVRLELPFAATRPDGSISNRYTSPITHTRLEVLDDTVIVEFGTDRRACDAHDCPGCEGCMMPTVSFDMLSSVGGPDAYSFMESHLPREGKIWRRQISLSYRSFRSRQPTYWRLKRRNPRPTH